MSDDYGRTHSLECRIDIVERKLDLLTESLQKIVLALNEHNAIANAFRVDIMNIKQDIRHLQHPSI